ncbi:MAG: hypothetical protein M1825_003164 [Sarcosagium campestre]|nr:MAG: hypothetical protein M1825_003164 [Sarcosagium campestre]
MAPTTPPPLQGPSSKEKKYDRQLRLWAANGQAALEASHVLLANSGSGVVGVEVLKNLILPGVGKFTICDSAIVTEADLGVNFFLDEDSLGSFRAQRCSELLQELNPDVKVEHIPVDVEKLIDDAEFLELYNLVIVTSPISLLTLNRIITQAEQHKIPVFYVQSVGFYSQISLSLPSSFPIVETHPEPTATIDLRLLNPWPELSALVEAKTAQLDQLSDHEHGHVPHVLLLLHYLDQWKQEHSGQPPRNYREKSLFRELVKSGARTNNAEGTEENFDEAVAAVLKSLNAASLTSSVRDVLDAEECKSVDKDSPSFWLIASAIRDFHNTHGVLPLPGSLPDMKAKSVDYISLQNVYKSKARKDFLEVLDTVRQLENKLGRTQSIDEKEVEAFCKGSGFVKLLRGRSLQVPSADHPKLWDDTAKSLFTEIQSSDSLLHLHIAFLAYDILSDKPDPRDRSAAALLQCATDLLSYLFIASGHDTDGKPENLTTFQSQLPRLENFTRELARADGSELHNISALTGGIVAQEAIKVLTKQYVPMDNTCLFDGVESRSQVVRL